MPDNQKVRPRPPDRSHRSSTGAGLLEKPPDAWPTSPTPNAPRTQRARSCPTHSTAAPPAAPMRINGINNSGPTAKKAKFRAKPMPSPFETAPHSRHSRYSLLTLGYLMGRDSPRQWLVRINAALWSGTSVIAEGHFILLKCPNPPSQKFS